MTWGSILDDPARSEWGHNEPVAHQLSVTFVCTGNICRSPIGEIVLRDRLSAAGLGDAVQVTSAGTGDWHIGEPADRRAQETLRRHGHDPDQHRARQFSPSDFSEADLVIALDRSHQRTLRALARSAQDRDKIRLLRSFDPDATAAGSVDVADPYFGSLVDFEETYAAIAAASLGLVHHLKTLLAQRSQPSQQAQPS
jgi:protein-tyrosine phosphatase